MSDYNKLGKEGEVLRRDVRRRRAAQGLARFFSAKTFWKLGVFSTLILAGNFGFAQTGSSNLGSESIPVAKSPWTSPSGRAIQELNVRNGNVGTRAANPIRQTQALTTPAVSPLTTSDDLLPTAPDDAFDSPLTPAPLNTDDPLVAPEDYPSGFDAPLDDPSVDAPSFVPQVEALDDGELAPNVTAPSPLPNSVPVDQKIESTEPQSVAPTKPQDGASSAASSAPTLRTSETTPQSLPPRPLGTQNTSEYQSVGAAPNEYATNRSARYGSTNPYSRIGQAEYNPRQFYGAGGNCATNGYRSTPPVAAFGQNLDGAPCVEESTCCVPYCGGLLQNTQLGAGVFGMRSPLDYEDSGNFGGDFSLNWGSARPTLFGLNAQAGARVTQADFNGTEANGFATADARTQLFWTAGVFFRAPAGVDGWTAGVVYDSLNEDYYRDYDLSQVRVELSRSFGGFWDVGFRGAFAMNDDLTDFLKLDPDLKIEAKATATSYYTMFLRKRFEQGGEATVFGGATEWSEGLVGASFEAPLSDSFAVRSAATYVIPTERGLNDNKLEENWNVSVGLVWYLGGNARCSATDSQRPLFDVADNGTFLQNFLR